MAVCLGLSRAHAGDIGDEPVRASAGGHETAECRNCGIQSLIGLHSLAVGDLTQEQQAALFEKYGKGGMSMYDVQQAARQVGLVLQGVGASLTELAQIPGPKILHLRNPDHFAALAAYRRGLAQVMDGEGILIVPEDELSSRYTGHALVVQREVRDHGPRMALSDFAFALEPVTVSYGKEVQFPFTLSNTGDEDLVLTEKPGCCGAPEILFSKDHLSPGESAECLLVGTIARSGKIAISRGLLSNDPNHPIVYLTIHGYVVPEVAIYPPTVLMAGEKGIPLTGEVFLRGPESMDDPEVLCDGSTFNAVFAERPASRDGVKIWRIGLSNSGARPGQQRGRLTVRLGPDRRELTVPVTAKVWPDLEISPPTVFLGLVAPGHSIATALVVNSRRRREFRVVEVRSDTATVVAAAPRRSRDGWVVPVRVECGGPGAMQATITITTDAPGEEILSVPVYAQIVAPVRSSGGESRMGAW